MMIMMITVVLLILNIGITGIIPSAKDVNVTVIVRSIVYVIAGAASVTDEEDTMVVVDAIVTMVTTTVGDVSIIVIKYIIAGGSVTLTAAEDKRHSLMNYFSLNLNSFILCSVYFNNNCEATLLSL